jgi:hypothetical protein
MWNSKLLLAFVALSVLCLSSIGCKTQRSRLVEEYTKGNIKKMAMIYNAYTAANKYQGPESEEQLKDWLMNEASADRMAKINVDVTKFDDYMISERTGEKFEVRWGVNSAPMGPPRPVIFEATAVDGIRQVGLAGGGEILDVDTDEEYDDLMSGNFVPDDIENYPNRARKKKK